MYFLFFSLYTVPPPGAPKFSRRAPLPPKRKTRDSKFGPGPIKFSNGKGEVALRRNIHIMETTTEYEKNIVLKILDGTCKVLLTHPEEKFNEVLPTVVQFLERTDHFPSEDRIKYMVLIEDEFKKVCTQSWHGWNNRLALERVYKTISNIRSGV